MANYLSYGIKKGSTTNYNVIKIDLINTFFCDNDAKTLTISLSSGEVLNMPLISPFPTEYDRYYKLKKIIYFKQQDAIIDLDSDLT